jgi:hypothetical protein
MGRVNQTIAGAFSNIVGNGNVSSLYDNFIRRDFNLSVSPKLKKYTNMYKQMVKENKFQIEKLAALEEIVMQMRIRENIEDIRIDMVRDYIYARCAFIRKGKEAKDIRVLVSTADVFGLNIKKIYKNEEFMSVAKQKLGEAMDKEIEESIIEFNKTYDQK